MGVACGPGDRRCPELPIGKPGLLLREEQVEKQERNMALTAPSKEMIHKFTHKKVQHQGVNLRSPAFLLLIHWLYSLVDGQLGSGYFWGEGILVSSGTRTKYHRPEGAYKR